jgi:hypothetical protein
MDAAPIVAVEGSPVIDGVLDDPAWASAPVVRDFLRFQPTDGGHPPGSTEVRVLYDDRNVYFSIRVRDAGTPIRARVSPRERIDADDQIGIYLDPFGRASSGYIFYFNALGLQQDIKYEGGSGFDAWNWSWDTVLFSEGRVVGDGYDLEVAIPFRSLKFPAGGGPQECFT